MAQRFIEELSYNAWPAEQTVFFDGWILRFASGYTKRANSIVTIYPSMRPLEEKINNCEKMYKERNLPTVFKMTTFCMPTELDSILEGRGYQKQSPSSVQLAELKKIEKYSDKNIKTFDHLCNDWLIPFQQMSAVPIAMSSHMSNILRNILPTHKYFCIFEDGVIKACGLGVVQSGFIGLFDIVTHPSYRHQGYGRQIVGQILAWGKEQGAKNAYLQVIQSNTIAIELYQSFGFKEFYQYWYRTNEKTEK